MKCLWCEGDAESERGIIYVRAHIKFNNLEDWINAPICLACWKAAQ